jgi:hypothetical protein
LSIPLGCVTIDVTIEDDFADGIREQAGSDAKENADRWAQVPQVRKQCTPTILAGLLPTAPLDGW